MQHAGRLGYRALALTDVDSLGGQVHFHAACRAHGIRPITGVELPLGAGPRPSSRASVPGPPGRLVLLAPSARAYAALCRIVTQRRTRVNATEFPPCLEATDVIWLCDEPTVLRELTHRHGTSAVRALVVRPRPSTPEPELIATARELGVPLVASLDATLLQEEERPVLALARAIALGRRLDELPPERLALGGPLLAPEAARDLFADLPDAVHETAAIARACRFDLFALGGRANHQPELRRELEQRCLAALDGAGAPPRRRCALRAAGAYRQRLMAEFEQIQALGLMECFASVATLVATARTRGIALVARGSAVSSLVGHLLGFSPIDPLEQGLYFERFASAARQTPPDIDLDVASRRRDELIEWLIEWRGSDRTARVSSLVGFRRRSALRAGLRALAAPQAVIDWVLEQLPPDELDDGSPTAALVQRHLPSPWREWLGPIERLIGMPRALARHPGGVVLSPRSLAEAVPLERTASGAVVTQYDAESLSRLNFVKLDLLGNHCLDELDEIQRICALGSSSGSPLVANPRLVPVPGSSSATPFAANPTPIAPNNGPGGTPLGGSPNETPLANGQGGPSLEGELGPGGTPLGRRAGASLLGGELGAAPFGDGSLDDVPLDDAPTLALIDRADTIGCYQLESPAQRAVLARLPIRRLDDIMHALAIVRPGPASGQAKEVFLARARGESMTPELHPRLAERLGATHGLLLFEEDISFLLAEFGGVSMAAAETLRVKLVARADDGEWLERVRRRFLARSRERGIGSDVARSAWSDVLRFASYSFNKAHAASQAHLAYRSAYAKCHAPLEHGAAALNHHGGLYPRRVIAADLARHGIRLLLPSLGRSGLACMPELLAAEGDAPGTVRAGIRIGLALIKGLRRRTRQRLLALGNEAARASDGPGDASDASTWLARLADIGLAAGEWRALVYSGACDAPFGLEANDYPWVHDVLLERLGCGTEGRHAEGRASEGRASEGRASEGRASEGRVPGGRDASIAGKARDRVPSIGELIARARELLPREPLEWVERYRALHRVRNELRYLELHVSHHPLDILRGEADRLGCVASDRLAEHVGRRVAFAGVLAAARRVVVSREAIAQLLTFEDEHGLVEARLGPSAAARLSSRVTTPGPFLVHARVLERQAIVCLAVDDLVPFHARPMADESQLSGPNSSNR